MCVYVCVCVCVCACVCVYTCNVETTLGADMCTSFAYPSCFRQPLPQDTCQFFFFWKGAVFEIFVFAHLSHTLFAFANRCPTIPVKNKYLKYRVCPKKKLISRTLTVFSPTATRERERVRERKREREKERERETDRERERERERERDQTVWLPRGLKDRRRKVMASVQRNTPRLSKKKKLKCQFPSAARAA